MSISYCQPYLLEEIYWQATATISPKLLLRISNLLILGINYASCEYRAMASTAAELTWLTYLLHDLGLSSYSSPVLFCDNTSALHMIVNPVFHARTKHIELDYHFFHEKVTAPYYMICSFSITNCWSLYQGYLQGCFSSLL